MSPSHKGRLELIWTNPQGWFHSSMERSLAITLDMCNEISRVRCGRA